MKLSRVSAESLCTRDGRDRGFNRGGRKEGSAGRVGGEENRGRKRMRERERGGEEARRRGKRGRDNESDRTKGRGLGACVPTQQYGEFREAAQYPPDRQLIDILPHTRHVTRAARESETCAMHRPDRRYACDFAARCRAFRAPRTSRSFVFP